MVEACFEHLELVWPGPSHRNDLLWSFSRHLGKKYSHLGFRKMGNRGLDLSLHPLYSSIPGLCIGISDFSVSAYTTSLRGAEDKMHHSACIMYLIGTCWVKAECSNITSAFFRVPRSCSYVTWYHIAPHRCVRRAAWSDDFVFLPPNNIVMKMNKISPHALMITYDICCNELFIGFWRSHGWIQASHVATLHVTCQSYISWY